MIITAAKRAFTRTNHACTSKFGLNCGIDPPTFYRIDWVQAFLVSSAVAADVPIPTDLSLSGMSRSWPAETCNSLYFAHILSACLDHREHVGTTWTKRIFKPIFLDKFNVVPQGLCCCITNWIKTFLLPQQLFVFDFHVSVWADYRWLYVFYTVPQGFSNSVMDQ